MFDDETAAHEREGRELRLKAGIEAWYATTEGSRPLPSALALLCDAFGADAAGLSRYAARADIGPRLIAYDRRPHDALVPSLKRAFTHCVLGDFAQRARPGSTWQASAVADLDPALTTFQRRRALSEMVVIPIGAGPDGSDDFLELHFVEALPRDILARIEMAAPLLHRAWVGRTKRGFFERIVASAREAGPDARVDLLACDNPARLSRAEFRVCHLLGQGLSNEAVQGELRISRATLRTHLRNIYAKAGVGGKAELVFRLLSTRAKDARHVRSVA